MSGRHVLVAALAAAGVVGLAGLAARAAGGLLEQRGSAARAAGDRFPHARHDGLFDDGCRTCHAGITGGDRAGFYPATADLCAGCHDGSTAPAVDWKPPAGPAGVTFDHGRHVTERGIGCLTCHRDSASTGDMDVAPARSDRCLACHQTLRERWHGPGFRLAHRAAAASGAAECASCHDAGFCGDCHQGTSAPGFHPRNYLQRHAAEAWARDTECASCHSTEVFCRSCHLGAGVAGRTADANAYHDAEPLWLLNHGRAARQGLETCAACHQQTDCLVCHSARSGWGIKPHGSSNPDDAGDKNPSLCLQCHQTVPGD